MARHRHGRSPARKSTACHQNPCRHSAALSSATHDQCTPSRTDFIPSWLQHVQTSYYDASRDVPREASPAAAPETSWHPNGIPNVRIQSSYDAERYQSSDLFIQDSPSPAASAIQTSRHQHYESDLHSGHDRAFDNRRGVYRSKTTTSTPPPASIVKDDIFEKRPRRKTRQDRYSTIKSNDGVPKKKQAKRPSARVSKMGRLRSSREVMANFKSSAITNPNERLTLKSTFTPGLFVNGRGSAPVADLVFNEIPLPDEDGEPRERQRSSNSGSNRLKKESARREEIKYLTNALKRLTEDYPAPDYPGSRSISMMSGDDFQSSQRSSTADVVENEAATRDASFMPCHRGLDGGGAPDEARDCNRPRTLHDNHTLPSHSICSHSAMNEPPFFASVIPKTPTPLGGGSGLEDQISPEKGPDLKSTSREELRTYGSQAVKAPNYQDKGVMVSPWMHQRTEIRKPSGPDRDSQQPCPEEGKVPTAGAEPHSPPPVPQIPDLRASQQPQSVDHETTGIGIPGMESHVYGYPTYLPGVPANLGFRAETSPAWFFGRPSSQYPMLTLDPSFNRTATLVSGSGPSASPNTQSKRTCNSGEPPQPAGSRQLFSISPEADEHLDAFCTDSLNFNDDLPGESLTEYIERMELEILGPDETSSLCIDNERLSVPTMDRNEIPEVPPMVDTQYQDAFFREIESKALPSPGDLVQQPIHEELRWPSRQYQSAPCTEGLDGLDSGTGSELASFWRPNYMMWC